MVVLAVCMQETCPPNCKCRKPLKQLRLKDGKYDTVFRKFGLQDSTLRALTSYPDGAHTFYFA